ncbi:PREDICTED: scarecrow-like protein 8 [Nelumbo nucifera]|uniref:Scarecrow-like protein 8 n=2 Tax=Nelumbo nucifera TaxID=4432 RepID=A0A1U7ZT69_NELNU|nr:PREDICTED: scarecrow-like protein 8 [Nelumbo nucifera]DAD18975.1 TPA_asm: hypothetical protein HUJ06_020438 [Nelumbo nucifera]
MTSRFSGSADFYSSMGISGGSAASNDNGQLQYRSQFHVDSSSPTILPRRTELVGKRSLAELERQQLLRHQQQLLLQQHQQQHQQQLVGSGFFARSVKPRTYHHNSPISPLSPVDFPSSEVSGTSTLTKSFGLPHLPQLRPQPFNPINHTQSNSPSCTNSALSGISFSNSVANRVVPLESEPDSDKMRSRLQELEKQLLDDNDEDEGDAASVITSSGWSETIQGLIQNQKPLSPSPTSSSSSSSASPSSCSSSSKQSLLDAAAAIAEGNMDAATTTLARLNQVSNVQGDPEQRLTAYMVSALRSRMNPTENPPPVMELFSDEHMMATRMLYEGSPCFKLGFTAANLAILEATRDQPNNVHVVDFDISQGSQYMSLIHALADRQHGEPTSVKITAVAEPSNGETDGLRVVGDRLRKHAERFGVGLKFNVVSRKIRDLNRETLGCNDEEALAVNFAFRLYRMPDESVSTENPRDQLLRVVKELGPRVVTVVEQEMNANTAPFVGRVGEVCAYYRAVFDSLDATMPRDSAKRVKVEECLGRKAANMVACEGWERIERCEVLGKWRARMRMAGFEAWSLGQQVSESMRSRLNSGYRNNPGFTIKEEGGGMCFGWMDRVLTVASAWR